MKIWVALIFGVLLSFLIAFLLGFVIIPWLRKLHFGQTILDIGPAWHKSKQGTPVMGGLMFIISIIVSFAVVLITDKLLGGHILTSGSVVIGDDMKVKIFAEFYDSFTDDVNYDKIEKFVCSLLSREGINGGLLLDLACGTGSLAVRLSEKGYSVIGTDMSPEMLSVAQQKAAVKNADILFLCQDMTQLNLYGTIICTVCTLDSLNHLKSLDEIKKVFSLVSLFTEEGGIFVFDVNTLYKHKKVLGNNAFIYENGDALCAWQNSLDGDTVNIELDFFAEADNGLYERYSESFSERAYELCDIENALTEAGFEIIGIYDGYDNTPISDNSQRAVFAARKGKNNG